MNRIRNLDICQKSWDKNYTSNFRGLVTKINDHREAERRKNEKKIKALEVEEVQMGEQVVGVEVEVKENPMMVTLQKIMRGVYVVTTHTRNKLR